MRNLLRPIHLRNSLNFSSKKFLLSFFGFVIFLPSLTWIIIYFTAPKFWTGFTDGYYYQLQIKTYLSHFMPRDINQSQIYYPYYFYFISAKIINLFFIVQDVSKIYVALGIISSISLPLVVFVTIRRFKNFNLSLIIAVSVGLIFYLFEPGLLARKPHELFAFGLSLSALIYTYMAHDLEIKVTTKDKLYLVMLVGFSLGIHPIIGFPAIAYLVTKTVFHKYKTFSRLDLIQILILSSAIALPSILPGTLTYLTSDTSTVQFLWPEYGPLNSSPSIYWLIIVAFIVLSIIQKKQIKWDVFFILVLYFIFGSAILFNYYIPTFSRILTLQVIFSIFIFSWEYIKNPTLKTHLSISRIASLSVVSLVLQFHSVIFSYAPEDLRGTYILSSARVSNDQLMSAVSFVDKIQGQYPSKTFNTLSNDEYRFIQLYLRRNNINQVLPFNEGWTKPSLNLREKIEVFNKSSDDYQDFSDWLEFNQVNLLILQLDSVTNSYLFEVQVNMGFPNDATYPARAALRREIVEKLVLTNSDWKVFAERDNFVVILKTESYK